MTAYEPQPRECAHCNVACPECKMVPNVAVYSRDQHIHSMNTTQSRGALQRRIRNQRRQIREYERLIALLRDSLNGHIHEQQRLIKQQANREEMAANK